MDEGAAQQLGLTRLDVGHHARDLGEDGAQLRARERGAEAVVRPAAAEARMTVGVARDVEAPGVLESRLVAVGRVVEEDHLLAALQALSVQLHRTGRPAATGEPRRRPPPDL